jgi:hypothetical protein
MEPDVISFWLQKGKLASMSFLRRQTTGEKNSGSILRCLFPVQATSRPLQQLSMNTW